MRGRCKSTALQATTKLPNTSLGLVSALRGAGLAPARVSLDRSNSVIIARVAYGLGGRASRNGPAMSSESRGSTCVLNSIVCISPIVFASPAAIERRSGSRRANTALLPWSAPVRLGSPDPPHPSVHAAKATPLISSSALRNSAVRVKAKSSVSGHEGEPFGAQIQLSRPCSVPGHESYPPRRAGDCKSRVRSTSGLFDQANCKNRQF
jgi:hypothetical protein